MSCLLSHRSARLSYALPSGSGMGHGGEGVTVGPRQGFFFSKLQSSLAVWQSPFLYLWRIKGPGFLELIWLLIAEPWRTHLFWVRRTLQCGKFSLWPFCVSFHLSHKGLFQGTQQSWRQSYRHRITGFLLQMMKSDIWGVVTLAWKDTYKLIFVLEP